MNIAIIPARAGSKRMLGGLHCTTLDGVRDSGRQVR